MAKINKRFIGFGALVAATILPIAALACSNENTTDTTIVKKAKDALSRQTLTSKSGKDFKNIQFNRQILTLEIGQELGINVSGIVNDQLNIFVSKVNDSNIVSYLIEQKDNSNNFETINVTFNNSSLDAKAVQEVSDLLSKITTSNLTAKTFEARSFGASVIFDVDHMRQIGIDQVSFPEGVEVRFTKFGRVINYEVSQGLTRRAIVSVKFLKFTDESAILLLEEVLSSRTLSALGSGDFINNVIPSETNFNDPKIATMLGIDLNDINLDEEIKSLTLQKEQNSSTIKYKITAQDDTQTMHEVTMRSSYQDQSDLRKTIDGLRMIQSTSLENLPSKVMNGVEINVNNVSSELGFNLWQDFNRNINIKASKTSGSPIVTYELTLGWNVERNIQVTFDSSTIDNNKIVTTVNALKEINATSLSENEFKQIDVSKIQDYIPSRFGFALKPLNGVKVQVIKVLDSAEVTFFVSYGLGQAQQFSLNTFTYSYNTQTIRQSIEAIQTTSLSKASFLGIALTEADSTWEKARTVLGIDLSGISKPSSLEIKPTKLANNDYVTYIIFENGSETSRFNVTINNSTADNVALTEISEVLSRVKITSFFKATFTPIIVANESLNSAKTKLGIAFSVADQTKLDLATTINAKKNANSNIITFEIKIGWLNAKEVISEVNSFKPNPSPTAYANVLNSLANKNTTTLDEATFKGNELAHTQIKDTNVLTKLGIDLTSVTIPNDLNFYVSKLANSLTITYEVVQVLQTSPLLEEIITEVPIIISPSLTIDNIALKSILSKLSELKVVNGSLSTFKTSSFNDGVTSSQVGNWTQFLTTINPVISDDDKTFLNAYASKIIARKVANESEVSYEIMTGALSRPAITITFESSVEEIENNLLKLIATNLTETSFKALVVSANTLFTSSDVLALKIFGLDFFKLPSDFTIKVEKATNASTVSYSVYFKTDSTPVINQKTVIVSIFGSATS